MSKRAALIATAVAGTLLAASPAAASPPDTSGHCGHLERLHVPHAPVQQVACLDDLTTAGTVASGHTDPKDWAGLHATGTTNPSGVPGIQVDGYFPDTSTSNTHHGWNHDSQFVIRVPDHWNGGLVVTGAPGVRTQYANDFIVSDWVLAQGYAFASTDKGNSGAAFYHDGTRPGDAIAEWNYRVTQLTLAAKAVARQRYGKQPAHTYMFGISNGGYLTRWQLENRPGLYDGGIDWEGTLFTPQHNLFTYLPTALKYYPAYQATGDQAAHDAMLAAGFAPGSEFLWPFHYSYYWDLTQRIYREEVDPTYDGDLQAGIPFCQSGTPVVRRRLRPGHPTALGRPGDRADLAHRTHRQAPADPARHARLAAADRHRLRRLRPHGRPCRARQPAPLLPDRGRQPRRRVVRRVPRPAAADAPVRTDGLHRPRGLDDGSHRSSTRHHRGGSPRRLGARPLLARLSQLSLSRATYSMSSRWARAAGSRSMSAITGAMRAGRLSPAARPATASSP